jgi:pilus assembly protein CpaF
MDERDDFKLLKQRLHRKVLDRLDLAKLGQTRNAAAQEQVLNFIRNLISDEVTPLSTSERDRLSREILDEIFGF